MWVTWETTKTEEETREALLESVNGEFSLPDGIPSAVIHLIEENGTYKSWPWTEGLRDSTDKYGIGFKRMVARNLGGEIVSSEATEEEMEEAEAEVEDIREEREAKRERKHPRRLRKMKRKAKGRKATKRRKSTRRRKTSKRRKGAKRQAKRKKARRVKRGKRGRK